MSEPDIQGREATFPAAEFTRRQNALVERLQENDIDLLIVTGPENICYLTGQQTPGYYTFQALLIGPSRAPRFVIRQLESMNCRANTYVADIVAYGDGVDPLARLIAEVRSATAARVAIDKRGWFLPITAFETLERELGALVDGAGLVESLRAIKSAEEIRRIEQAAGYVDAGMTAGLAAVADGASENDIVSAMLGEAVRAGSEYLGMEPLVSSGPRSGVPHGTWRRRRLTAGDPVFLEMAACHDRYHAVLMRSAWLGEPPALAKQMMQTCQDALEAAIETLYPGRTCAEAHAAAQDVIDRAGFADNYRKRTGYSVGLAFAPDWGEWQVLSLFEGIDRPLAPGMVFHVPPALRAYGEFTVGVSETVVVTENGPRVLGRVPRELHIAA